MSIKIASLAVLAVAGAASAAPFSVSGLVDFGGPGNAGAALTVSGGVIGFTPGLDTYAGPGSTGVAIAPDADNPSTPTLTAGSPGFSFGGFEGGYAMSSPVASGFAPDGRDGVFLMNLVGDFSSISISDVNVEITDGNGTSTINFTDFDTPGNSGSASYELAIFDEFGRTLGGKQIWVVFIPTPGAAGMIGLAGLAAMRRRR
ncbi:MAG: hypothetical protein ACFHWZ_08495 [Phycisphaerales bacterium]|nr:hypothetical protein [bacterium]